MKVFPFVTSAALIGSTVDAEAKIPLWSPRGSATRECGV